MENNEEKKFPGIIAIDGPAASGKSTLAEKLSEQLGYLYFDTGVMYRAVTLAAQKSNTPIHDEDLVTKLAEIIMIEVYPPSVLDGRKYDVQLDGEDVTWEIRSAEVESFVSIVSAYPGVRTAMTEQQRKIGRRGNTVMVGRDIGTVVFPEAELKIYLNASAEERSKRRFYEAQSRGRKTNLNDISSSLKERDRIDSTRSVAPLKPAEDAVIIDTNNLDQEAVFKAVLDLMGIEPSP